MCGIVGYTGNKNALPILIDGLCKLEYRGYDSSGIATFKDGAIEVIKNAGKVENLIIPKDLSHNCGIGHNRWATHGGASTINAHPHLSHNKNIAIVHNGIIENYMDIKKSLTGYTFKSETDTEIIANLIDSIHSKGKTTLLESVRLATKSLHGSYAIGVLSTDNPNEIIAAKQDNPLIIGVSKYANMIASDFTAIIDTTKNYILLDDGEIARITPESIETFSCNGDLIEKEILEITWDIASSKKDGFEHFLMKEIMEQPKSVQNTLNSLIKNAEINLDAFALSKTELANINNIHIVACGSAFNAGMVGKHVIEKLSRIKTNIEIASEFRYNNPIIDKNDLVIIISQSGETADTLAALRKAKSCGAITLAIVNVVESTIAREADSVLYTICGPEISVATTKAYSAQISALYVIANALSLSRGHILSVNIDELLSIPEKIIETQKLDESIKKIAQKYKNSKNIFFVGRGIDFALCEEASLKLKELSYIHSEAYPAGEFKHGTISLIENGTLVIGVCTQKHLFEKMQSNLKELSARGATIILLTTDEYPFMDAAEIIKIPKISEEYSPSLAVIPMQLLAYHVSNELGLDVDKPRNLAKSVTVE